MFFGWQFTPKYSNVFTMALKVVLDQIENNSTLDGASGYFSFFKPVDFFPCLFNAGFSFWQIIFHLCGI